jgi:phenylacetate-coenzyme A ligase PaaK-like adenylate-forming protein
MPGLGFLKAIWDVSIAGKASRGRIRRLREARLRNLLRHARARSSFYRERIPSEHASLSDLPVLDKKLMMDRYDDLVCDPALDRRSLEAFLAEPWRQGIRYKGRYHVLHSSGTTGAPAIFAYGPGDWDALKALAAVRVLRARPTWLGRTRLAYIGAADGHYAGASLAAEAAKAFKSLLCLHIGDPHASLLSRLKAFQPHVLTGYSSAIALLAKERLDIRPERVICSGDPLTPEIRESARKAFHVEPVGLYAASESVCMGAECRCGRLHLFDDMHCFELVDEELKPVPPGEPGILLLTNLYNHAQPLIRYKLNDRLVLTEEGCPCGWPFLTAKPVEGRQEELLWFGKEYVHPIAVAEIYVPGLERFQVQRTGPMSLLLWAVVKEESALSSLKSRMSAILEAKGLSGVSLEAKAVASIPNDPKTGKFRLILP